MKKNHNVIHKDTLRVCCESLVNGDYDFIGENPQIKKGDTLLYTRYPWGWDMVNNRTLKHYQAFLKTIRNGNVNKVIWQVNY